MIISYDEPDIYVGRRLTCFFHMGESVESHMDVALEIFMYDWKEILKSFQSESSSFSLPLHPQCCGGRE